MNLRLWEVKLLQFHFNGTEVVVGKYKTQAKPQNDWIDNVIDACSRTRLSCPVMESIFSSNLTFNFPNQQRLPEENKKGLEFLLEHPIMNPKKKKKSEHRLASPAETKESERSLPEPSDARWKEDVEVEIRLFSWLRVHSVESSLRKFHLRPPANQHSSTRAPTRAHGGKLSHSSHHNCYVRCYNRRAGCMNQPRLENVTSLPFIILGT